VKVLFINPQQEMGGIQCLSAFLKAAGHETALANDANLFDNPWVRLPKLSALFHNADHVINKIISEKPDLIALSAVTDDFGWAVKWAKKIKAQFSIPIVIGNTYPTFHYNDVMTYDCFDYAVRGEGEQTLLELVEVLQGIRKPETVLGLCYKDQGQAKVNQLRPLIENLDTLPFPDKDLYYEEMPYLNHGYTTMTGRGCPYRCTFCDNNSTMQLYRKEAKPQKWTRRHSPEYVVDELIWAKNKYKINHVRFNDEDFSYDKKWIREFCELYGKKVRLPYFAWVYPNTIDEEIAGLLAASGCTAVEMGIQSGSQRLRKEVLNRHTSNEQILKAMKCLRDAGIRVTVDVIIGLPTETKDDLDMTIDLLAEANPWHLYAFWLRYYPSTEILQIAKDRKLISMEDAERIEKNNFGRGHISGGTELERNTLARRYHAFLVMLPLFPKWWIKFCRRYDLIRFFPSFISPVLLVNITKEIKRDSFNEFRARGWRMIFYEFFSHLFKLKIFRLMPLLMRRKSPLADI
jgi:radical SAM superfamily enzyme YgiQ (UPF0313 family)